MSEEEKQVLQTFKNGLGLNFAEEEIILNLIDRLQKELEYEKEVRIRYERRYDLCKESKDKIKKELEQAKKQLDLDYVDNNYVSKDKIKDKIKEIGHKECEDMQTILFKYLIIEMLEDLLKE